MRCHDLVVIAEVFDSCSTDVGELSDACLYKIVRII